MKIPGALEEMVAGLISDEQAKREEIEDLLGQIHELTEPFFNPDAARIEDEKAAILVKADELGTPAPVLSQTEKLKNFTSAFERRGMPPERAHDAAEEALGMRDGTR